MASLASKSISVRIFNGDSSNQAACDFHKRVLALPSSDCQSLDKLKKLLFYKHKIPEQGQVWFRRHGLDHLELLSPESPIKGAQTLLLFINRVSPVEEAASRTRWEEWYERVKNGDITPPTGIFKAEVNNNGGLPKINVQDRNLASLRTEPDLPSSLSLIEPVEEKRTRKVASDTCQLCGQNDSSLYYCYTCELNENDHKCIFCQDCLNTMHEVDDTHDFDEYSYEEEEEPDSGVGTVGDVYEASGGLVTLDSGLGSGPQNIAHDNAPINLKASRKLKQQDDMYLAGLQEWHCHKCTVGNDGEAVKCCVCGAFREGIELPLPFTMSSFGELKTTPPKTVDPPRMTNFTKSIRQRPTNQREVVTLASAIDVVDAGWKCTGCTYFNLPLRPGCEICGTPRPANYRPPPGYTPTNREQQLLNNDTGVEDLLTEEALQQSRLEHEIASRLLGRRIESDD